MRERGLRREEARRERGRGLTRRELLRALLGGVAAPLLAGCGGQPPRGGRLTVWSCGGNYDLLLDFHGWLQQEAQCRITYSSAPVEYLIATIVARPRGVDVLVGRSGPGWQELTQKGRLAGRPEVFALDPYVIITPVGNPGGIRGLADLKRSGVRTVYAPTSSGPSGPVIQILLQTADQVVEPGIWEGYVRNAIEAHDCGWKVFPPVIEGRAHASVTRLSMTTVPDIRGKVEVIPVPVEVMAAMTEGQGAIPQRLATLSDARNTALAAWYANALLGEVGADYCQRHGFIHRLSPEADRYAPLFKRQAGPRQRGQARRGEAAGGGGAAAPPRRGGRTSR